MTERNEHDERGDRRVFEPAIARLREELADFERQASATRALIEALLVRAGATDPTRARIATAKARTRGRHRSSRATSDTQKRTPACAVQQVPTNTAAAGVDGAKELAEIVAAVARSQRDAEVAIRSKDVARLKTAVAAIARAERRGGEILIALAGKVKVPVSRPQRQRWRGVAALAPKQFEMKLERMAKLAIAALDQPKQPSVAPAPPKPPGLEPAQPKRPSVGPAPPAAKLTAWHTDETGALSRELSS